jgi:LacI family transcriptional regulator
MKKARISQQQIAADLGVSQTLVSMVLNGRRKGVSEESCQKILDHARRSGYRPKGIAAEFLSPSVAKCSVGLILRTGATLYSQSPFFGHVQHGLHDYLAKNRGSLVFMGNENDLDGPRLESLQDPDAFLGLVVLGEVSRPFLQAILKLHSRVVTVSCQYPGLCDSVLPNEEQAAELMVQHLLDLGHRSFAWIGGNKGSQRSMSRLRAIQSALHLRNVEIDPKFCIEAKTGDRREGSEVAEAVLEASGSDSPPTAWICFNGVMARGAVSLLASRGFNVPADISLAAFDGTRVCEEEHPTLTTAFTSPELMGQVAAEILLEANNQEHRRFSDLVLPAEITYRESTAAVAKSSRSSVKKIPAA